MAHRLHHRLGRDDLMPVQRRVDEQQVAYRPGDTRDQRDGVRDEAACDRVRAFAGVEPDPAFGKPDEDRGQAESEENEEFGRREQDDREERERRG